MDEQLIQLIEKEESFLWENYRNFEKSFCNVMCPELISTSFSTNYVKFDYCDMDSGQHFSDSITILEYNAWKEMVKINEQIYGDQQ
jgi:hypothetical protein